MGNKKDGAQTKIQRDTKNKQGKTKQTEETLT